MSRIEHEKRILNIIKKLDHFGSSPFKIKYQNYILSWHHPITNEGLPDPDYLVFAIQGSEIPSIWSFQNNVNFEDTIKRVMSAKRVGSYFVLMRQWGMVKLSRPKEIHHAPF
jgi:hypothetical protein